MELTSPRENELKKALMPPPMPMETTLLAISSLSGWKPSWVRFQSSSPVSSEVKGRSGSPKAGCRLAVPTSTISFTPVPKGWMDVWMSTTQLAPAFRASASMRSRARCLVRLIMPESASTSPPAMEENAAHRLPPAPKA